MSKLDLQKELLEKVKLGTKPSDILRKNIRRRATKFLLLHLVQLLFPWIRKLSKNKGKRTFYHPLFP